MYTPLILTIRVPVYVSFLAFLNRYIVNNSHCHLLRSLPFDYSSQGDLPLILNTVVKGF